MGLVPDTCGRRGAKLLLLLNVLVVSASGQWRQFGPCGLVREIRLSGWHIIRRIVVDVYLVMVTLTLHILFKNLDKGQCKVKISRKVNFSKKINSEASAPCQHQVFIDRWGTLSVLYCYILPMFCPLKETSLRIRSKCGPSVTHCTGTPPDSV